MTDPGLPEVLAGSLRLFSRGVADRRSPFRTPSIATAGPDGVPAIRTMVLRGFDPAARRLTLHSDRRAAKLADIARNPRVAVHVYDARASVQLRLSALAAVHMDDATARAAWDAIPPPGRAIYAINPAPGTAVKQPPPPATDADAAFAHFAVLALIFDSLEWLWLDHAGHRRARFTWNPDGSHHATWLVP